MSNQKTQNNTILTIYTGYTVHENYTRDAKKITDTAHHGAKIHYTMRAVITNQNVTASKTVSGLECRQRRETSA